jgi:hypothetical protein
MWIKNESMSKSRIQYAGWARHRARNPADRARACAPSLRDGPRPLPAHNLALNLAVPLIGRRARHHQHNARFLIHHGHRDNVVVEVEFLK